MCHALCNALMLQKQFLGTASTGWFAIALPAVHHGINLEVGDGTGNGLQRTLWDLKHPTTNIGRWDTQFNIHPRDSILIDASPCLRETRMTVYSWAETQARQLRCEWAYLWAILPSRPEDPFRNNVTCAYLEIKYLEQHDPNNSTSRWWIGETTF